MKRVLRIAGGMLGLLFLGTVAVVLALSFSGLRRTAEPVSEVFKSPIKTPTGVPSPAVLPTMTRGPKPTPSSGPIPTITSIPTPLSLPPSAFYALWVESIPEGSGGIIWLADPADIGQRQMVVQFDDQEIYQAIVSPNGRQIAFTAATYRARQSPLWVVDIDGSNLKRLVSDAAQVLWSPDSRTLVYSMGKAPQGSVLETVNITTGDTRQLMTFDPNVSLHLLGWSTNGQELYHIRVVPRDQGYDHELWTVDQEGRDARRIASLGSELGNPLLSPDGARLLYGYGTPEGLPVLELEQGAKRIVQPPGRGAIAWTPDGKGLLAFDIQDNVLALRNLDVATALTQNIALIQGVSLSGWQPLAMSPDRKWLAAYLYLKGYYWIHLPSGMIVSVPSENRRIAFVAWAPKLAGK